MTTTTTMNSLRGYDPTEMDFSHVTTSQQQQLPSQDLPKEEDSHGWNIWFRRNNERAAQVTPAITKQELENQKPQVPPAPRAPRLPSLRNFPYKVIIRPKTPVDLQSVAPRSYDLEQGIQAALNAPLQEKPTLRIIRQQNILMVCTHCEEDAFRLAKLTRLYLDNKTITVTAYVALPEDVCRGVIHNIRPDVSNDSIFQDVSSPSYKILGARRLGKTTSAVIVFAGKKVPLTVNYGWSERRCYIYRKTKAACVNCGMPGHRADVCPKPKGAVCENCGTPNPGETHECAPVCALCKGPHKTYSRDCKEKFYKPVNKNTDSTSSTATTTKPEEEGRSRPKRRKQPAERRRGASASTSRSRSISQARSSSKGRGSASRQHGRHVEAGKGPQGKNQAKVDVGLKQTSPEQQSGLKVSWKEWPSLSSSPNCPQKNTELAALTKEIERLKTQVATLTTQNQELKRANTNAVTTVANQTPQTQTQQVVPSPQPVLGEVYQQIIQELRAFKEEFRAFPHYVNAQFQDIREQIANNRRYTETAISALRKEQLDKRHKTKFARSVQVDEPSDTDSTCQSNLE